MLGQQSKYEKKEKRNTILIHYTEQSVMRQGHPYKEYTEIDQIHGKKNRDKKKFQPPDH